MRRLFVVLATLAVLVLAPPASAWTWPLHGDVLRPYSLGPDAYAAGQHRGIDVAGEAGEPVRAPASGVVSFAGVVPSSGRTVTIQLGSYAVSLTHLGEIGVEKGLNVSEGEVVGVAGGSGDTEWPTPYVHLGIRVGSTADAYVDPMTLLPPRAVLPPPGPPPAPAPAPVSTSGPAPAPSLTPSPPPSAIAPATPQPDPAAASSDPVSTGDAVEPSLIAPPLPVEHRMAVAQNEPGGVARALRTRGPTASRTGFGGARVTAQGDGEPVGKALRRPHVAAVVPGDGAHEPGRRSGAFAAPPPLSVPSSSASRRPRSVGPTSADVGRVARGDITGRDAATKVRNVLPIGPDTPSLDAVSVRTGRGGTSGAGGASGHLAALSGASGVGRLVLLLLTGLAVLGGFTHARHRSRRTLLV